MLIQAHCTYRQSAHFDWYCHQVVTEYTGENDHLYFPEEEQDKDCRNTALAEVKLVECNRLCMNILYIDSKFYTTHQHMQIDVHQYCYFAVGQNSLRSGHDYHWH